MSGEGSIRRYDVEFKKVPGTLSVTESHIAWVPKAIGAMDRQSQAMSRVTSTSSEAHLLPSHSSISSLEMGVLLVFVS
jgi:hypothetical protein